ncbi:hypothetical protein PIB30_068054 [Stylosanthes scabra]|uniref:Uncharacterized protein n=1 Tax=Stylosanthes scabra TaxID=79078 RepID=A0ABU6RN00_9FABA|nr:hypothetical protein [Stylosanthes scabra]
MPLTMRPCQQHGDLNDTDSIRCKLHYWNSESAARVGVSGLSIRSGALAGGSPKFRKDFGHHVLAPLPGINQIDNIVLIGSLT